MRVLAALLMTTIAATAEPIALDYHEVEITPASVWKDELGL